MSPNITSNMGTDPLTCGLDGGGTKLDASVIDSTGQVLAAARSGGVNRRYVSAEACTRHVTEVFEQLAAQGVTHRIVRIHGIMVGQEHADVIARYCPNAELHHVSEYRTALAAGGDLRPWGLVVIAGTGSGVSGWRSDTEHKGIGGWGMHLGDEGSATDIVLQAMRICIRARDGRLPGTLMTERMMSYFEMTDLHTLIDRVSCGGWSRDRIAGFSPYVTECADAGDALAAAVLNSAAMALAEDAAYVAQCLFLDGERYPVVLSGGVFRAGSWIIDPLTQHLARVCPGATPAVACHTPAYAAARLAMQHILPD